MNNQLKLGIFIVISILSLIILIIAIGTFPLEKTYNIYVKFDNISGITNKSKVKIAGVNVGILKNIYLEHSKAVAKLSIFKNIVLYRNASANIVTIGIIGNKYININPGNANFAVLKNGDCISSSSKENSDITLALTNITNKISKALNNENGNIIENLAKSIHSLNEILDNLATHSDRIVSTINNFNKFSDDIANISEQNKQNLADIILFIRDISTKMSTLINKIYNGDGFVSTLINDEQMKEDLKETVNILNHTIKKAKMLHLNFEFLGQYNIKNKKYINNIGIRIIPNNHKFYYIGTSNITNIHNMNGENNTNTLDALLGLRLTKSEIYTGIIKNKVAIGFGYSFFQPIYISYKTLRAQLNTYNFDRNKYGPLIDVGLKIGITKWLYIGIGIEDITHNIDVTSSINIEI
jgi:phospholipid/cholesterol/gamma-HCH transport system substrate-binding protein